jgi:hypothetical protein
MINIQKGKINVFIGSIKVVVVKNSFNVYGGRR